MGFNFNALMERIAVAIVLEGTKMPTVNSTQSLKILTESNIIRIGRVAFDVPIDAIETPKIRIMAINSTTMLQRAKNKIGRFFIKEPRSVLITDSIKALNLLTADVFNQCGVEKRCVGHVGGGGFNTAIMTPKNQAGQPLVNQTKNWHKQPQKLPTTL